MSESVRLGLEFCGTSAGQRLAMMSASTGLDTLLYSIDVLYFFNYNSAVSIQIIIKPYARAGNERSEVVAKCNELGVYINDAEVWTEGAPVYRWEQGQRHPEGYLCVRFAGVFGDCQLQLLRLRQEVGGLLGDFFLECIQFRV